MIRSYRIQNFSILSHQRTMHKDMIERQIEENLIDRSVEWKTLRLPTWLEAEAGCGIEQVTSFDQAFEKRRKGRNV